MTDLPWKRMFLLSATIGFINGLVIFFVIWALQGFRFP